MVRRGIAAGAGLLLLVLLVFGVRGCLNARKEQAIKDYVRDVGALLQESDQQSRGFFELMSGSAGGREQAVDMENQLNGYRVNAAQLVDRARDTDHPGEVDDAQRYLIETLEFRRDGLAEIADALPQALGDQERRQGTQTVTANMQDFLASDVIYAQRFVPNIQETLKDEDLAGEVRVPSSQFLPNIQWLQPSYVSQPGGPDPHGQRRQGRARRAGPPRQRPRQRYSRRAGPDARRLGEHHARATTSSSTSRWSTRARTRRPTWRSGSRSAGAGDAIEVDGTLDTIAAGETKTVKVALDEQPPTGQNVPITVELAAVPGEKKTDNNKQTYSAVFTR